MKAPVSVCEKTFVLENLKRGNRLDGRTLNEFRHLEIFFGSEYGCCNVALGETRVLAQVVCELDEPRAMRPNEGQLFINVEFGAMAAGGDSGRQSQQVLHMSRFLEMCFKESRCVDLEALCIISEETVWTIRIKVNVLNNDGNLLTCASIAVLAALAHFRTPVVTFEEDEIVIHPYREKLPIPLTLHHFPVTISYTMYENGELIIADPTELEEKMCDAELVYAMNSYRELCTLNFTGKCAMTHSLALSKAHEAAGFAVDIVAKIKEELAKDGELRGTSEGEGLATSINPDRLLASSRDRNSLRLAYEDMNIIFSKTRLKGNQEETAEIGANVLNGMPSDMVPPSPVMGTEWAPQGGKSTWMKESSSGSEESSEEEDDEVEVTGTITDADRIIDNIELSGDSEEEEKLTLKGTDVEKG